MNIMWEMHDGEQKPLRPARIPWLQFQRMMRYSRNDRRTLTDLIEAVAKKGFCDEDGHRFNISREWDTMDPEAAGFQEKMVDALVSGVWIADLWITEEFETPKFQGIYRATGAASMKARHGQRPPGHTVLITGYGLLAEDWFWEFLNSHGQDYEDQGFGKASNGETLNWLYKPKVLRWW